MRELFLALLSTGEAHGYELGQALERSFGDLMPPLNAGQIYTTLARLERDGLVSAREVENDQRGKRVYALTDRGESKLRAWIETPVPGVRKRNEFFLKFVLAVGAGLATPRDLLETQRVEYMRSLRDLDALLRPPVTSVASELLVEGTILHVKADLEWLDLIEQRLEDVNGAL